VTNAPNSTNPDSWCRHYAVAASRLVPLHPGATRLGRGLAELVEAQERQPDGLRKVHHSVVKALFPAEAERITAILEGPARKPRKPTLVSVARAARKAAIPVARYEIKLDGTIVVVTGEPEPVESENPWPLDEFRTKETKQ